jgi:DNA topoisomerase VI subunit A
MADIVSQKMTKMGEKLVLDIEKKQNPNIEIPIRALSNIIYDKKTGTLMLGDKTAKRFFFNVAHARKFMQTLMVSAFCKSLIDENIHTSIRDMYYNLKRTLPDTNENTFDEQSESDPIIVDIEVALDILREQLRLTTDRKGIVAGRPRRYDKLVKARKRRLVYSRYGRRGQVQESERRIRVGRGEERRFRTPTRGQVLAKAQLYFDRNRRATVPRNALTYTTA